MNRPKTTREWHQRLAAGERFKQIDGTGRVMSLKKLPLEQFIHVYVLLVDGVERDNMLIFICDSCIHKVESTGIFNIKPDCRTQDLLFSEIEFLNQ